MQFWVSCDLIYIDALGLMNLFLFSDLIGVCKEFTEIQQFTAKSSGKELTKRDITLVDTSNASVRLNF